LNLVTLIVDLDGGGALVFGARGGPEVYEEARWRRGVTIGLTVAGTRALLGTPMRHLTGRSGALDDVLGERAGELAERLDAAPRPETRFGVLDELLTAWLRPERGPDGPAARGWWRLQETAGRTAVGKLAAEAGVSRRRLETGFRQEIGLSPKTVGRIARFQRAVQALSAPSGTLQAAVACGYADQPHFNREVRAMAGVTPTELCALLQYDDRLGG
ncbi:helix-turn-helix domain-containing protein, partial [Actinomadura sp. 7K507]|uniref:helix-turn-helix domain-containing protein n=1 Tax=Actinomadura sp. 7K507 TaxID=2530365 RepID=UPI00104D0781